MNAATATPTQSTASDFSRVTASNEGVEVLAMWDETVQHVRYLRRAGDTYSVGSASGLDCAVPPATLPSASWPLVQGVSGGEFVVCVPESAEGEVVCGPLSAPDVRTLAELRSSGRAAPAPGGGSVFAVAPGARVRVALGPVTFMVQGMAAPERLERAFAADPRSALFTVGSLLAHLMVFALIVSIAPDAHSLGSDAFAADSRFAKFILRPTEKPLEKVPSWLEKKKLGASEGGKSAKRYKDAEGKMGDKNAKPADRRYGEKGPKDADIVLARTLATEAVKDAGLIGMLKAHKGGILTVDGGADRAIGNDELAALGHLMGDIVGTADGSDGRGLVGLERGGGGDGDKTIGLDDGGPHTIGTYGPTDGDGIGDGCAKKYGCGAARFEKHTASVPDRVVTLKPTIRGGLDMETIRRVIRKHLPEMKYCYDRELLKNGDLHGKVKIDFVISPSGAVVKSAVSSSTVDNTSLEGCVVSTVSRLIFPKPEGGGIVEVSYPFVFNAPLPVPAK